MLSLLPSTPEPTRHEVRVAAEKGEHGGPTHAYRGAVIRSNETGTVLDLALEGLPGPAKGWSGLGNLVVAARIVDSWSDHGRLPAPYALPK